MKSFTIYEEYFGLITILPDDEAKDLWFKLAEYMFYDKNPKLNDNQNKVFNSIKRPFDTLKIKSKNGSITNQNEIKNKSKQNQKEIKMKSKQNPIYDVNVNVNDNVYVNVNDNVYKNIINKLNELTNSKYNYKSKETQKLINGRLNDGYTEEDLIMVVEKMCYYWNKQKEKGGKDMTEYLRPSTLFRPTNFENYYNLKVSKPTMDFSNVDWSNF